MESLTKQQRHEIYKEALEVYNDDEKLKMASDGFFQKYTDLGICQVIYSIIGNIISNDDMFFFSTSDIPEAFDELTSFRPIVNHPSDKTAFWFDNIEERKEILKKCIELSKD